MSIRLLRLYTGPDGQSHFDVGDVPLADLPSLGAVSISLEETPVGSHLDWHNAPCRQFVITLSGTLEFETRGGARETLAPGDILLAEDTTGGGHRWRLIDGNPWRRVYVALA